MEWSLWNLLAVFCASVVGAMGLGGGSVLLLYLTLFSIVPQSTAQAINLILFLPTAAVAIWIHKKNGLIQPHLLWVALPAGIGGGILGSLLANRMDGSLLNRIFSVFLLWIGVRELFLLWKEHLKKSKTQ